MAYQGNSPTAIPLSTDQLQDGLVTTPKIANNAVTDIKINDGSVTETKLGTGAVTADKIGSSAVVEAKIGTGAVTADKIGSGAVTEAKLATDAVTTDKIANNSITSDKIAPGTVIASDVGDGAITTIKIDTGAVTTDKIADANVTSDKIASNAITSDKVNTSIEIQNLTVNTNIDLLGSYSENKVTVAISSGTLDLDLSQGTMFVTNLTENITSINVSNYSNTSNQITTFTLVLVADGTGRAVTWPASFKFPNNSLPTISSSNTKMDVFTFFSINNGTSWNAFISGQNQ